MNEAAQWWLSLGLNVVPQNMQTKHPSVRWKELQRRQVTLFELHAWRKRFCRGIGVICGAISNLVVIDTDGEVGENVIREWEQRHGPLPPTRTVRSGSGRGLHRQFAHPGYRLASRSFKSIQTDIRADGGYSVLPPSLHASGGRYVLVGKVIEVAELPDGFLEFIEARLE